MINSEDQRRSGEKANLAIQAMADNAQVAVAVAIGIFGILAIFITINALDSPLTMDTNLLIAAVVILSIAYWGIVILGLACYIFRRLFEGLMNEYTKTGYPEYENEIRQLAKHNTLTRLLIKVLWPNTASQVGVKYKGIWPISILYLMISFLLWFIIGVCPSLRIIF
jgi:hypothetical protein